MNIKSIELNNWQSFRGEHTINIPAGLIRITGLNKDNQGAITNRAGKTALLNAIIGCLYSKTPLVSTVSKLINSEEKNASVGLVFDTGKVVRYLKDPKLGNAVVGDGLTMTQEYLEGSLGMNFDAFVSTVFFGTNYSDFLEKILKHPTEAKELLTSLLPDLQIFDKALEWVKEQISMCEVNIRESENKLNILQGNLSTLKSFNYTKKIQDWETDKENELVRRETEINSLQNQLKVPSHQLDISKNQKLLFEVDSYENANHFIMDKINKLETKRAILKKDKTTLESQLVSIKENRCPTCGQVLPKKSNLKEFSQLQLNNTTEKLDLLGVDYLEEKSAYENNQKDISKMKIELVSLEKDKQEHQNYIHAKELIQNKKTELVNVRAKINPWTKAAEENKTQILGHEKKMELEKTQMNKLQTLINHHNFLLIAFGPRGIKNFVFDEIVFRLTDLAQKCLDYLTEGTIQIRFDPRKQKKSGGFTETIGLEIYSEADSRDFFTWSQSERKKVSLATSLAMNQLLRDVFNSPFEFMVFDETFDGLDEVGVELFCKFLRTLLGEIKTILVVTHNPYAEDLFDHTITVIKENGVSSVPDISPKKLRRK